MAQQPLLILLITQASRPQSLKSHNTRQDSSGRVINPTRKIPPDNKQHAQETERHAPAGFEPQPQQASGRKPTL
jgi:hypothetical protein